MLSPEEQRALLHWLVSRQNTGYTGRPNKSVDSCYSFWVGASIAILLGGNRNRLCTPQPLREFLISVQTPIIGGFSREEDVSPDPMHTYMSIMGLSLIGEPDLAPVDASEFEEKRDDDTDLII